jgi:hypothetical protein
MTDKLAIISGPVRRTGIQSFIIPAQASIALNHEILSRYETINRQMSIEGTFLNTAINIFGEFGQISYYKLFLTR